MAIASEPDGPIANQKEQTLNKILNAYELSVRRNNQSQAAQLMELYLSVQGLGHGGSLAVTDSIRVKQLVANTKEKKRKRQK